MHSPRGHVHMEMATKSMSEEILWSSSRTVELIEQYEAHPCLCNTKLKEYHDRNLKSKAWREISTVLSKSPIQYHTHTLTVNIAKL